MITALDDITAVWALQTAQGVPSSTTFTFNFSVAVPISYGLQAFSSGYRYDSQPMQACKEVFVPVTTISEWSSYTCTIPAITAPGLHNLTVGFSGQSAYGYFFLDVISLTS